MFILTWFFIFDQVNGLCKLLSQNRETLTSLELIHCKLSSTSVNSICDALIHNRKTHGILHFSINASHFDETDPVALPSGLVSFFSSGRYLHQFEFHLLSFHQYKWETYCVVLNIKASMLVRLQEYDTFGCPLLPYIFYPIVWESKKSSLHGFYVILNCLMLIDYIFFHFFLKLGSNYFFYLFQVFIFFQTL